MVSRGAARFQPQLYALICRSSSPFGTVRNLVPRKSSPSGRLGKCSTWNTPFHAFGLSAKLPGPGRRHRSTLMEMRGTSSSRRVRWGALLLGWPVLLWCAPKKPSPPVPWQIAERARQQLLHIPPEQRAANDYRTVMDAYRLIYHANPADMHAPEAVFAVGLLLADEGETLHQPKMLQASIGQFDFLRTQYPQSSFRIAALLEEAHVAAEGLRDVKLARAKYTEFAEQYPHSTHIAEAQSALQQLRTGQLPTGPVPRTAVEASIARAAAATSNGVPGAAVPPEVHAEASLAASQGSASQPIATPVPPRNAAHSTAPLTKGNGTAVLDASAQMPAHTGNGLAAIFSIRHWSTPTYTRVAIDLGDDVQYEAARVPNPDRIYFDLHGTRLAQEIAGKSFTVTDTGFLERIRTAQYSNDTARVVLDVNDVKDYSAFLLPNPYRLIIDIHGDAKSTPPRPPEPGSVSDTASAALPLDSTQDAIDRFRDITPSPRNLGHVTNDVSVTPGAVATRSTSGQEMAALGKSSAKQPATAQPTSLPIAVVAPVPATSTKGGHGTKTEAAASAAPVNPPLPTTDGQRTLQRALGLKISRIVIDPGHGGHDSGTIGADGIMEKDVVLDVALRLGTLLHDKLGATIIYTRSDDTFIPLETRTAIANKAEADLFISVHANSSDDETARGVETYYLNFTAQPDALDVAARENAVSDQGVHQLADLVKKITLKDKIDESREFASDVEQSLYDGLRKGNDGLKNRGVKKAPFVVLIGANMPSILTEISFVTNSKDAAQLRTPEYRERVAESIYRGIATYTGGLSGTRIAAAAKTSGRAE